jgi:MFS family permease
VAGSLFSGALCDRLVARDQRWQLALPMVGIALSIPAVLAFLLWPASDCWQAGALRVPHAMIFALLFSFFASWFPALSYAAASQMVAADERSTAVSLINLFMTLFGAGLGPLLTGMLSDYLVPFYGHDALRYALVGSMTILVATVALYGAALNPYGRRLASMHAAASQPA